MKKELSKKLFLTLIISIMLFSSLGFISAQEDLNREAAKATEGVIEGVGQGISSLMSKYAFGDKEILTRIFFFILLFMIIYSIVGQIFKTTKFTWVITLIITALAILWIPSNFLDAIRTQYGAMGAAILSLIPFVILLVFSMKVDSRIIANLVWIFFFVYYFTLYIYTTLTEKTGIITPENIPYGAAMIVGLFMIIFIGRLRGWWWKEQLTDKEEAGLKDISFRGLGRKLEREETRARTEGIE